MLKYTQESFLYRIRFEVRNLRSQIETWYLKYKQFKMNHAD